MCVMAVFKYLSFQVFINNFKSYVHYVLILMCHLVQFSAFIQLKYINVTSDWVEKILEFFGSPFSAERES